MSNLNTTYSGDCTPPSKLWLKPADSVSTPNTPASYACTTITSSTCTGGNLMYYDSINNNRVYSCLASSTIVSNCAGYIVYQWITS